MVNRYNSIFHIRNSSPGCIRSPANITAGDFPDPGGSLLKERLHAVRPADQPVRRKRKMMKQERQQMILDRVEKDGRVTTNDLVAELGLAEDTIRKDFQELSKKGLVKRVHGGVMRIEHSLRDVASREAEHPTVKQELAQYAAQLVADKHVLYIDGGTTNLCFARSLPDTFSGMIITNAPAIAMALVSNPNVEISLIGGTLQKTTQVVEGLEAIQQIQQINIECSVLGVSSISPDSGITYPSSGEAMLKKTVIEHSRSVLAIANKEKLSSTATFYTAGIDAISTLVTNETNPQILAAFQNAGVNVMSVNTEAEE